ncbi:MAG TPA: cysteine dioxygenase family protein [Thermomicrobiales bacterium]|nr:cysteine dioxygenase family protein [Thermomicrobiales bacterium]
MTATTTSQSAALKTLAGAIRAIVQSESDPALVGEAVAVALKPNLGDASLLTDDQLVPDADHYRQHILHVEPDGSFSIVALVWLPGQETPIHDHVCWCVVGVHLGEEHETTYTLAGTDDDPHLVVSGQPVNLNGTVAALVPPGDIHKVANDGDSLAVSLHIYGADIGTLGTSIRRRYDLPVRA